MPINLFFSNDTMELFNKLCDNYTPKDILNPDPVLVGGQMGSWLQYHMAQKYGIVANLNVGRLEKHLWGLLKKLDSYEQGTATPLNKASLTLFVAHTLMDTGVISQEVYKPLKQYLGDSHENGLYFKKLIQLSQQIATVFIDYEFKRVKSPARNGVIESWLDEDVLLFSKKFGKGVRPDEETWFGKVEQWQKALYRELFQMGGVLDRYAEKNSDWYCSLPMYERQVFEGEVDGTVCQDQIWHIFAMSQISLFHRKLIFRLSELGVHFYIYALNPCAEFWEDLVPQEKRTSLSQIKSWNMLTEDEKSALASDESELGSEYFFESNEAKHPLLAEWGRPGREGIKLWCQATDYEFQDYYSNIDKSESFLSALRYSLLHRTVNNLTVEQDATLQFWKAPEIKRECETLYDSIVHTLRLDDSLRFHDIAVFVADLDRYAPIIKQVFDARNHRSSESIPFTILDSTSSESLYVDALSQFMQLSGSMATRKELFTFLENPCVQYALGFSKEDLDSFINWANSLNVYRHFDTEHRKRSGYAEEYIHTWRMALDRLLAGQVAGNGVVISGGGLRFMSYSDIDSRDPHLLSRFVTIIEKLNKDLDELSQIRRTDEWLVFLPTLFSYWVAVPEELNAEKIIRDAVFEEIPKIAIIKKRSEPVEWALVKEFIEQQLPQLPGYSGSYLTGGVTVASLSPKPPVPYECIYVLGLNEGVFPSRQQLSSFDLRGCRREIGDFTQLETDRYLMLELITSVKKQMVVSYINMDVKKSEELQPSSMYVELKEFVEEHLLHKRVVECNIPLLNSCEELFECDYSLPLVYKNKERGYIIPGYSYGSAVIAESLSTKIEFIDRSFEVRDVEPEGEPVLSVTQLKYFLENPLLYRLRYNCSLFSDEEDLSIGSDEPLSVEMLEGGNLKKAVFSRLMSDAFIKFKSVSVISGTRYVNDEFDDYQLRGVLPTAALGMYEKNKVLDNVDPEATYINELYKELGESYTFYDNEQVTVNYSVPGQSHEILLQCKTGYLFVGKHGQRPILIAPNFYTKSFSNKHLLLPYAQYVMLSQSEKYRDFFSTGVEIRCRSPFAEGKLEKIQIELSLSGAERVLDNCVREIFYTNAVYSLPFEALYKHSDSKSISKINQHFEGLGLAHAGDDRTFYCGISEGDIEPQVDTSCINSIQEAIDDVKNGNERKDYIPHYQSFDKLSIVRPDSLTIFLKRFGGLIGGKID